LPDPTVNAQKAEQLDKVFKHVKQHGQFDPNAVPGLDPQLVAALGKLNPKELRVIADLNDDLFNAGFGVSGEFRVSMV
jgi:hypothetical protein